MVTNQEKTFEIIQNYTSQKSEQLLFRINLLSFDDDAKFNSFNIELQKRVRKIYCKMMEQCNYEDLASLLEAFFKSLKRGQIKISVVIWLMDNILQCVGVTDLQKILKIFSENIGQCGGLLEVDQNKLLKIINHLLKRVSKTQDYHLRGQLQLTLTMILPLCHDSGFHRRGTIAKTSSIEAESQHYTQIEAKGGISFAFYEQFWSLQRYLMDPNQLNNEGKQKISQGHQNNKVCLLQLKKMKSILNELIDYFAKNPISQVQSIESQPIKFLKIFNLLPLQLNDLYFRSVILLQVLIFCFALKNPASVKNALILTGQQKLIVQEIEKSSIESLKAQSKSNSEVSLIYQHFTQFLKTEVNWLQLKDNWKQQKKNFLKNCTDKEKQCNEIAYKKAKQAQLHHLLQKVRKQIDQKMSIDGSNLTKFIQNHKVQKLAIQPLIPSFSYFFTEAARAVQTFDHQLGNQYQFQSRSEYNMFQWKAMRSLYRQNLKDVAMIDKANTKIKQYRLLNLVTQRADELFDQPRKKVKTIE